MFSVHPLRKGCLALGLLLGALLLPAEVRAAHKLPTVPDLVLAQRLLESAQSPALKDAAGEVQQAILSLAGPSGQKLFVVVEGLTRKGGHRSKDRDDKGSGSSPSSGKSDQQLAVEALDLLRAAQTQLAAMKGGPKFQEAISHIQSAEAFIAVFLAQS